MVKIPKDSKYTQQYIEMFPVSRNTDFKLLIYYKIFCLLYKLASFCGPLFPNIKTCEWMNYLPTLLFKGKNQQMQCY